MSCQYEKYISYLKNFHTSSINSNNSYKYNSYNPYKSSLSYNNDTTKLKEQINILTDLVISYKKELDEIKYMLNENKNNYKEENVNHIENIENTDNINDEKEDCNKKTNKKKYIPLIFIPFLTYFLYKKYKI